MSTLREVLEEGRKRLRRKQITDGDLDAWYLLEFVCGIDRNYYFLHGDDIIEETQKNQYLEIIERRGAHIPLQQLTGSAHFMGFVFQVNDQVLIPRQDTEILVETALERLTGTERVLDLCTGSGCIIVSLAKLKPGIAAMGIDLSEEALKVARMNARNLNTNVQMERSDLFCQVSGSFNMIVSNPPYIKREVIPTLMEEVRVHEPVMALDGGWDGLDFYRTIVRQAGEYLTYGGWLGLEIGYDQGADVRALLSRQGYCDIEVIRDLAGLDRVVWAKRPQKNEREEQEEMRDV